jgi:cob(I)alamin adenosyltransferase
MTMANRPGDAGMTTLMYNRRVSKTHPRVEACGTLDELNAALGVARAAASDPQLREDVLAIQKDLVLLMGELATSSEDLPRYSRDGFHRVTPELTARLDRMLREAEARQTAQHGWAIPGANLSSAALDMARTICRRAERRVCTLQEIGQLPNTEILVVLNRLSDLLWLFARWADSQALARAP